MSKMCQDWVVWLAGSSRGRAQGERRPVGNNNRQIARAGNQRGVVRWDRRMRGESKAADRSSKQKPIAWLKELTPGSWVEKWQEKEASGSRMASVRVQEEGDDGREGSASYFARDAQFSQRERLWRYIFHYPRAFCPSPSPSQVFCQS